MGEGTGEVVGGNGGRGMENVQGENLGGGREIVGDKENSGRE